MIIERNHINRLLERISEARNFIQVVMGPRQVGKTTLIFQLLKKLDIPYEFSTADAVSTTDYDWIHQRWETARLKMKSSGAKEFLLIIDEIQKIQNWSEIVKLQWDSDTRNKLNIKVILLGSSRLLIQKGLTESLAGRFETMYVGHWGFEEMQQAFDMTLEQYIYYGGYPGSASLINDEDRWKNYIKDSLIETSISKDILMLTRVDKPALLKRLFEIGSLYSGKILSMTKLMGELQDAGNATTLSHYLNLLGDSGLLCGLDKYAGKVNRQRASIPKFQVYNSALLSALHNLSFELASTDAKEWGHFVETSIGAHLVNHSITERYKLYYWREGNKEVDFIMEKKGKIIAIEVKSGKKFSSTGLSEFVAKFQPARSIIVGTGGLGIEEFLKMNPNDMF